MAPRRVAAAVAIVGAFYLVEGLFRFGGADLHAFTRDWVVQFFYVTATGVVALRARRGPDRLAWALLAIALGLYAAGFALYAGVAAPDGTTPIYVHALWVAFYPLALGALVAMLRARVTPVPRTLWVDSVVGAVTVASLLIVWVYPALHDRYDGDLAMTVEFLVYPVADSLLVTLSLVTIALTGGRAGRSWALLTAGFTAMLAANSLVVYAGATQSFARETAMTALFPAATLLIAGAALTVPSPLKLRTDDRVVRLMFPGACVVIALVLLVTDQFVALPNDRVVLPLLVIAVAGLRVAATIADVRRLYESRRFERGFEDAKIGMALLDSGSMRWLEVNRALAELLGYPARDLIGTPLLDYLHPDDRPGTRARRDAAVHGEIVEGREVRMLRADGSVVDVLATTTLVPGEDGGEPYFFSQVQDITDRRRGERQKAAIATLGHRALEVSDVWPLTQEAVRLVAETTGAAQCALLRLVPNGDQLRFEGRSGDALPPPTSLPSGGGSQSGYTLLVDAPVISDLAAETRFTVPDGVVESGLVRAASVPVRRRGGSTHVLIVHKREREGGFRDDDIRFLEAVANVLASALDRIDAEDELRRRALEDPLTGLANRALLATQLEQALHAAARHNGQVAVLLLDLDRFKYLNDTLGHGAGDELLRKVAARLQSEVREEDVVARLGGDEFVVVCTEPAGDAAIAEIAQRIVDVLAEPFAAGDRDLFASASVGVAVGGAGSDAEGLLRDADAAMYRAKEQGGARYEIFDAELRARLLQRLSTEEALRRALDREELSVRYQPVVEPHTGRVAGFEALLRWHHPDRGPVSPAEFIPIAEETDLILPIGAWVLRTACEQAVRWNAERGGDPLKIAVNLSPRQVTPDLVGDVAGVLADTGLPASALMLEITESLLLDRASTIGVVSDLRALGVRVALDDFGSGYSSLSYLQSYPLDVVKLDRGFVQSLDESPASAAVVKAAIDMAAALGLEVVAEGVERESQLTRLRDLGCPLVQGFLFAPALAPAEAAALLGGVPLAAA